MPATGQVKRDVWLLTDILDPAQLSLATAAKFSRWRWRNEGVFRAYKRTINKLKLSSRTVRLVHREAEASLLALQILLAHADLALRPKATVDGPVISPRKVLIEIRREWNGTRDEAAWGLRPTSGELPGGVAAPEEPEGTREGPRRTPHKPPGPPGSQDPDRRTESLTGRTPRCRMTIHQLPTLGAMPTSLSRDVMLPPRRDVMLPPRIGHEVIPPRFGHG